MDETNPVQEPSAMTYKYGPVTIHQSGVAAKELAATPVPPEAKSRDLYRLAQVRLSMHVERSVAPERYSADYVCITRFPEFGYEYKHHAPCEMRVGQLHGAAVVQANCIGVDFDQARDTLMEVEYLLGSESVITMSIPIKFPAGSAQSERTIQFKAQSAT